MKIIVFFVALFCSYLSNAQIVINEIDADNPGSDNKEFVELKTTTPNLSLNGYVMVFFNGQTGSGLLSYYSLDLDGYTTDANGIIHFGNSQVSPTPKTPYFPLNTIQNGPDVIALYTGNDVDYPANTSATNTNLIDAVAYSTSTTNPTSLMTTLGITYCSIDNQPLGSTSYSIQRKNDGTYEVKAPTPGANNDGSGIVIIYMTTTTNLTSVSEGQSVNINFTTSQPVENVPLQINFSLNNGNFNVNDYSGATSVSIPVGATTIATTIQLLDDSINEGDEEMLIEIGALPIQYSLNTNSIVVRVFDINFVVSSFGTPLNPTYGNVTNAAPTGYYSSLEGLSGATLKQALQNIIANPTVVRAHTYGDVIEILKTADQNPENSNQVWLIYSEEPRSKIDYQTGNSIIGKWNREHIYCQSRGNFGDTYNASPDGINLFSATGPSDIGAGLSDAHHLRAVDGQENSSRNNRNYGVDYNGPTGNPGTWKGDVARACFYMAVRYNGLNVVNGNPIETIIGQIGDLTTLLSWNQIDPSDDFEMNRNNYIYTWQYNRNPFIDYPNLADYIWGANVGQPWFSTLSTSNFEDKNIVIFPNPAKDNFTISGLNAAYNVKVYNSIGSKIYENNFEGMNQVQTNWSSGMYFVKITSDDQSVVKKIIIE